MSRSILITGATRGIGAGLARAAALRGWSTFLIGRDPVALEARRHECQQRAPEARHEVIALDLTSADAVARLVEQCRAWGWPEVVVHNAAVGAFGRFEQISEARYRDLLRLNLEVPLLFSRSLLADGPTGPDRYLVFIGSTAGRKPVPFMTAYSTTKAALHYLALALREEVREAGVQVLLVIPGAVRTQFSQEAGFPADAHPRGQDPEQVGERILAAIEADKSGILVIGTWKERVGGFLQRILPPTWWARLMYRAYAPLARRRGQP